MIIPKVYSFLPLLFLTAYSQIGIYVDASNVSDIAARQLVYEVKEKIRSSSGYKLSFRREDAFVIIHIIAVDDDTKVAYSAVWTVNLDTELYYNNAVGLCGIANISNCSASIVSRTDQIVSEIIEYTATALEKKKHGTTY